MRERALRVGALGVLVGSLLVFVPSVFAASITYTITGTGSGQVGASTFTNAAYTIQVTADTAQVVPLGTPGNLGFEVPSLTALITVAGIGTVTVTEPTRMFVSNTHVGAGFSRILDLLDVEHPLFATWDLKTPIGPLADLEPFAIAQFTDLSTSLGLMTLSSSSNVTFEATGGEAQAVLVPTLSETGFLVLTLALALLGVALLRQRPGVG